MINSYITPSSNIKKKAIALLCITPNDIHINFFTSSKDFSEYDIYFICDNQDTLRGHKAGIIFIQISDTECESRGYIDSNFAIGKKISAWDRAIYYFCEINTNYDYVWFIEDDVFIPHSSTLYVIDNKYRTFNNDLLCEGNSENSTGYTNEWHWRYAVGKINIPWYCSMVCAIRVSNKLLECIRIFVEGKRTLVFIEIMFNTIAMQNGLSVAVIEELSNVVFRKEYMLSDFNKINLYHPVKDISQQEMIRKNLNF